jgi:hypothetical protein
MQSVGKNTGGPFAILAAPCPSVYQQYVVAPYDRRERHAHPTGRCALSSIELRPFARPDPGDGTEMRACTVHSYSNKPLRVQGGNKGAQLEL